MKRPYVIIGLLMLLFAAPGIAAFVFFMHPSWLTATTNRGQLLQPPKTIISLAQSTKWQLVYWQPHACEQDCAKHMNDLARIRLALGRQVRQIDTVLLIPQNQANIADTLQQQLTTEGSQIRQVVVPEDHLQLGNAPVIYIANKQHALILAYADTQPLDDIFQDLKHLVTDK